MFPVIAEPECCSFVVVVFKNILFIHLREREHEWEWREGQRKGRSRLPAEGGSPTQGLVPGPQDHDLSQRQVLNKLSHQGTPG